jgi:hypothetical protein
MVTQGYQGQGLSGTWDAEGQGGEEDLLIFFFTVLFCICVSHPVKWSAVQNISKIKI